MTTCKMRTIGLATFVGLGGLFVDDNCWTATSSGNLVTKAEARIGNPLTPFSVAGVARRTTRRAVWAGTVAGGAYYGYGYPDYGYGSGHGYSYPYYGYGSSYGYGYPNYGYGSSYGYGYPYSYASSYPSYYGYSSAYYGASNAYYRPWGWRRGWW